jgi:hypothetical protein
MEPLKRHEAFLDLTTSSAFVERATFTASPDLLAPELEDIAGLEIE